MASIVSDPNGRKRILFVDGDGNRKAVRLGKASMKQAEAFNVKVEQLVSATLHNTGAMDDETARWLAALDDRMHARLAKVGLGKPRNKTNVTLKAFLTDYFASLAVKAGTVTAYDHTRRYLLAFFGESCALRSIEPAQADQWRQYLKKAGLSDSTIARRVGVARQIFNKAVKWKLLVENPFSDVAAGSQVNKKRMYFLPRQDAQAVLDACPDAQWRLLFALSRYGGLRCPSEHLALKWADVDWEKGRIRVPSCKTEHHDGGECRYIPLFPELRPYLLEVFELAEPGSEYVITRYRSASANLRTQLGKIIRRAGLTPWPKLFHNLRSTRQTELAERYPIHVVCEWLGNSQAIAQEHYLQVTDAHFTQAVQEPVSAPEQAAQKAAQYRADSRCLDGNTVSDATPQVYGVQRDTTLGTNLQNVQLGAAGFEPAKA